MRWLRALTILLGGVFIVGQGQRILGRFQRGVTVRSNLFATTFFTLTGFHGLHVCVGLVALLIVLGLMLPGDFKNFRVPTRPNPSGFTGTLWTASGWWSFR